LLNFTQKFHYPSFRAGCHHSPPFLGLHTRAGSNGSRPEVLGGTQHENRISNRTFLSRLISTYIKRACSTYQNACFRPIKNVYRDKNVLLLCHLSKVIKIACYSCQILKLFLIIVFLITVL
jgi:hypothetical protein